MSNDYGSRNRTIVTRSDTERYARELIAHLKLHPFKGNVIAGNHRLYVYVYGEWEGRRLPHWKGVHIEWNVGRDLMKGPKRRAA